MKKKKKNVGTLAIKPMYLMDFLASFQQKSEEIYLKVFMNEIENNDSKKINFKRFLSSELDQKTETDEIPFLSNSTKKPGL